MDGALPFVGRRRELELLRDLVARHRVVTIVGPGGMGKTRLATEFARLAACDYDGTFRVAFAGLVELQSALSRLAEAIGVRLRSNQAAQDAVQAALRDREALLVLDETESAPAVVPVVRFLLECCSRVHVLLTSRAPMTVAGERVAELGPLEESVELFVAYVRAVRPGLEIEGDALPSIAALCRRLGGVPLAIELAAAHIADRARGTKVVQLDQTSDVEHLRTLEGVLEWAHRSLPSAEMRFFNHLGVFPETFSLDAARAVATDEGRQDAAAIVERLQSKALLKRAASQSRFFLHPVVRRYALERLNESGEADRAHRKFCAYYDVLVARQPNRRPEALLERVEAMAIEWPNLREVLRHTLERRTDVEMGCRVVLALSEFWVQRGLHSEALYWILSALEVAPSGPLREEVLFTAALNAHGRGDFAQLESFCRELIAIYEPRHDSLHLARSLNGLANARYRLGDSDEAEALYWRAIEQHRLSGDRYGEATVTMNLGALKADRSLDFKSARSYFLESLRLFQEFGLSANVGTLLANLAEISSREGDHERAIEYAKKSRDVFEQLGNEGLAAWQLVNSAQFELERGMVDNALAAMREARTAFEDGSMSSEHAAGYLETAFLIAADTGYDVWAAKLQGCVARFRELHRVPRSLSEASLVDPRVHRVRETLGNHEFERLYAEGMALDDAAVEDFLLAAASQPP